MKRGSLRTIGEIVLAFQKKGLYVDDNITQTNFPLNSRVAIDDFEIKIIDPDCFYSEDEGIKFLKIAGLLRPTEEHALRFARQYGRTMKSNKDKPNIVFLHKPWLDQNGERRTLVIDRGPYDQGLNLGYLDDGFDEFCVLAGLVSRAPR